VSTLRSALDDVAATALTDMSDDELAEHLTELERASRVIEAERSRAIVEADARRSYVADGFLATSSWLAHRLGVSASTAAQQVRLARALARMHRTRSALANGEISTAAAAVLATAHEADRDRFGEAEPVLLDAARALSVRDLFRAVEHWKMLVDAESGDAAAARRFERRGFFASLTLDGMIRVDGNLDPENGQTVLQAIGSVVDADVRGSDRDDRRPAQRRADALGHICRAYLESMGRPAVAGERPHVNVTVDLATLQRDSGVAELDDVGFIAAEDARRIACDATVGRVVTGSASEPLDVGRRTAVVPPALRRALVLRDRGCRFPGCDWPQSWCDAHHVEHWADGGSTSLENLVLLCRRHHRLVHERFAVQIVAGKPVFARPDGSVLEDRAPP
jgi:Domain of unknown function (DUF222)/HNH endonuclease